MDRARRSESFLLRDVHELEECIGVARFKFRAVDIQPIGAGH